MNKFTLEINLGNDAMQDSLDIAMALKDLANDMADTLNPRSHNIYDMNGNTVGTARFTESN